jgi:glycosyltransferase involved in cell wall biosynthesis
MGLRGCFVVNAVDETSVPADIATALVAHTDVEVSMLAWFDAGGFAGDDRIEVTCLDAPATATGLDGATYRAAREAIASADVVQAHHNHSGSIAKVIARLEGVPCVSREGNQRRGFTRKGLIANGLTNPLAARVVPNSRAVYESFRPWERALLSEKKITVIPNGVDFDRLAAAADDDWDVHEESGADRSSVLVGTAGLLTEQKNHETLVRAVAEARDRASEPIELVVAGDGPRRERIESLARSLGVADAVHLLGYRDRSEVYAMLSKIDVYAMPSRWEGFSAAAVEAMGSGLPCVFSEIDPFTIPYGDVALFHPVEDATALADHLCDLADDPDRRRRLGAAGASLARETYDIESVAARYRALYEEIV